eukprot:PLAT3624.2.p1 GENE.PLAT3624.2~~PLAT3624.2.p1  ORF type:complete len:435 (-),score=69.56 PLAT3624.2:100-1404(-)
MAAKRQAEILARALEKKDMEALLAIVNEAGVDAVVAYKRRAFSLLCHCACYDFTAAIISLIESGADVHERSEERFTALHLARSGSVVEALLAAGADINAVDKNGCSPLLAASFRGHVAAVEALLSAGADVNLGDVALRSPLFNAAWRGHQTVVEALIAAAADVNLCDGPGCSPLFMASWSGHLSVVEVLVTAAADVNLCSLTGRSPLMAAAEKGHVAVAQALLSAAADVNCLDSFHRSALYIAADKGHAAVVDTLLSAAADASLCDRQGCSPLSKASAKGHVDVVKALLSAGADVHLCDSRLQSPLFAAAASGQAAAVDALLAAGADVNQCSRVCACVCQAIAAFLPTHPPQDGFSPLYVAGEARAPLADVAHVVTALVHAGGGINLPSRNGRRSLHKLARLRSPQLAACFLYTGAAVDAAFTVFSFSTSARLY